MSRPQALSPPSSSGEEEEEEDEGVDAYRKGGYHAVRVGDQFAAGRYVAQRKLGWGNFSTVWLAFDTKSQKFVALKIQKSAPEFAQAALHEIEFLSEITKRDPSNCKCIIQLMDHFKHTGPNGQHICLVFEFLGDSLLKLVQYNRYRGIGLPRVRDICKSILVGLDYLHRELGIIHSDLKLENVLLVSTIDPSKDPIRSGLTRIIERPEGNPNGGAVLNPIEKKLKMRAKRVFAKLAEKRKSSAGSSCSERSLEGIDMRCKIVDFGNACWADKQFTDHVQTRQYRAPEVILGAGYSFSVDMWSFACIAYELATGEMLFTPNEGQGYSEDEDHLALMMELLGKMPKKIATAGTRSKEYFDRHGDLKRIRRLKFLPMDRLLIEKYKIPESDVREFADFLCPLLDFTPEKRPTAAQCLQHPWLQFDDGKTSGAVNNIDDKPSGAVNNGDGRTCVAVNTSDGKTCAAVNTSDGKTVLGKKSDGEIVSRTCAAVNTSDGKTWAAVNTSSGKIALRKSSDGETVLRKDCDNKTCNVVNNNDGKTVFRKNSEGETVSRKNSDNKTCGAASNSEVKNIDVKLNTGSVAASIQRLESSMGKVQIRRYR